MTDETKKLFDAPWCSTDYDYVEDSDGYYICEAETHEQSNRLARLPELYDALMEARNEMFIMLNEWALGKSEVDYLESFRERKGKNNYEFFNEIQELLKKVRDGE